MRIISEGNYKQREIMECKCGCKFEYTEHDVEKEIENDQQFSAIAFGAGRDVIRSEVTKIKCPWCHKYIEIDRRTLSCEWEPWRF